jgi:hypothetical protein
MQTQRSKSLGTSRRMRGRCFLGNIRVDFNDDLEGRLTHRAVQPPAGNARVVQLVTQAERSWPRAALGAKRAAAMKETARLNILDQSKKRESIWKVMDGSKKRAPQKSWQSQFIYGERTDSLNSVRNEPPSLRFSF